MKKIAIFCATDDRYIIPSLVALQSIRRFHPEDDYFLLGEAQKIPSGKIRDIEKLGLRWIDCQKNRFQPVSGHWSAECFLKLKGPEIFHGLGYDYSLGVDGDILCIRDLNLKNILSALAGYAGIALDGTRSLNFADPEFIQKNTG